MLQDIFSRLKRVEQQLKSLSNKSPRTLEEFLIESSRDIHDNHLLMIEVKYALCLMYGNIAEFRYEGSDMIKFLINQGMGTLERKFLKINL